MFSLTAAHARRYFGPGPSLSHRSPKAAAVPPTNQTCAQKISKRAGGANQISRARVRYTHRAADCLRSLAHAGFTPGAAITFPAGETVSSPLPLWGATR